MGCYRDWEGLHRLLHGLGGAASAAQELGGAALAATWNGRGCTACYRDWVGLHELLRNWEGLPFQLF